MAAEIPNDIPGNSKIRQNQIETGGQPDGGKPPVPVFQGPTAGVKRKDKHPLWHWFKRMFLSDRKPSEILQEILEQRIVPGIKDNVRNSAMATIDSFIYQGSSAAPVSSVNGVVSYNRVYNNSAQARPATPPPTETKTDEINRGFSNPCFKSRFRRMLSDGREEPGAEEFMQMLKNYNYPNISVHTMYLMQGKHIDYTWDAYGWNRDEILAMGPGNIKPTGNAEWPFMIVLPQAHPIQ